MTYLFSPLNISSDIKFIRGKPREENLRLFPTHLKKNSFLGGDSRRVSFHRSLNKLLSSATYKNVILPLHLKFEEKLEMMLEKCLFFNFVKFGLKASETCCSGIILYYHSPTPGPETHILVVQVRWYRNLELRNRVMICDSYWEYFSCQLNC